MGWKKLYEEKLMTASDALDLIKSGDKVALGHAMGEPGYLVRTMCEKHDQYRDVEISQLVPYSGLFTKEEYKDNFTYNALFAGAPTREAVADGRADFTPIFFHEVPKMYKEGFWDLDAALVMVSPPDEHGYCSFGISVDYTKPAAEHAKVTIAQVNKYMPRTLGDAMIHVKDLDAIVEYDEVLPELQPAKIGEVEKKIGEYCARLVPDGAVLQLGIGAIPDAVLNALGDKKDLGLHSEMVSDGVIPLLEKGVINNKTRSFMPGLSVITFLMGTRKLYDYVNNNPSVYMAPVDFVNDPVVVSKNDRMVSINSAIEVDLYGQVVSGSIGHKVFSGVGGQVDFVRGAAMAKDGVSIIAFPSTVKGKASKIVPVLKEGSMVTTSINDVDYIVTEFGIARLKGRTLRQRAVDLIKIAHPDFRDELKVFYKETFKEDYPEV